MKRVSKKKKSKKIVKKPRVSKTITDLDPEQDGFFFEGEGSRAFAAEAEAKRARARSRPLPRDENSPEPR